jgi:hypothetical protein
VRALRRRIAAAQRSLSAIYDLELGLRAECFLMDPRRARQLQPPDSPRSGVLVIEEEEVLSLGLYIDPRDARDPGTIVEETSHLLCLAWHAAHERPVSPLLLELQAEVDRYAVARVGGGDGLGHFRDFHWAAWMDAAVRRRYRTAHRSAQRYCRGLERRYPLRADTPALLSELRRFYRASREEKLGAAA